MGCCRVEHWETLFLDLQLCPLDTPHLAVSGPSPPSPTPQQGPSRPLWGCSRRLRTRFAFVYRTPWLPVFHSTTFWVMLQDLSFLIKRILNWYFLLSRRPVLWLTFLGLATGTVSAGSRGPLRDLIVPLKWMMPLLTWPLPFSTLESKRVQVGFFVCLSVIAPLYQRKKWSSEKMRCVNLWVLREGPQTVNIEREGQRGRGAPGKCQVPEARKIEWKSQIRSHKQLPAQTSAGKK